jgi:hypothetical protein
MDESSPELSRLLTTRWSPQGYSRTHQTTSLNVGDIIAYEFDAYRITNIVSYLGHYTLWPTDFQEKLQLSPGYISRYDSWPHRPMRLDFEICTLKSTAKNYIVYAPADHFWAVLPEHYAICNVCLKIPPCLHAMTEKFVDAEKERLNALLAILPGDCHGCREPITSRQKRIMFTGENLIRPDLGADSAVFHARKGCRGRAEAYDKKRAKAFGVDLELYCPGRQTIHLDGSTDCSLGASCTSDSNRHAGFVRHRVRTGFDTDTCWCLKPR